MTMIIKISLCRTNIGSFFVTKIITPWSSTMIVTNGHLVDNYALEWPLLTIMCQNMKVWVVFFHHFFAMAMVRILARGVMMFVAFPFCFNVLVAMFIRCIFYALWTYKQHKGFLHRPVLLWARIWNYGGGEQWWRS